MRALLILLLFTILQASVISETENGITMSVELAPGFDSGNITELITHTFRSSGDSPIVFYEVVNNTDVDITRSFFEITVTSENLDTLMTSTQNLNSGITIPAGQSIRFSNKEIIEGSIQGVNGPIKFDFEIGSDGRNLINSIREGAVMGNDRYTVTARLFKQIGNSNEVEILAESSTVYETRLSREQIAINTDEEAVNRLSNIDLRQEKPSFQWAGLENQVYRLVIVEDSDNLNAEQSLDNRFRQEYSVDNIRDLSENVYLDILTRGNVFELPETLINTLEQGKNYAWQVRSNVRTTTGPVQVESEIWRFSTNKVLDDELISLLSGLIGRERVQQMVDNGLQLHRIELNGDIYTAEEAVAILREMTQKINNNKAKVGE